MNKKILKFAASSTGRELLTKHQEVVEERRSELIKTFNLNTMDDKGNNGREINRDDCAHGDQCGEHCKSYSDALREAFGLDGSNARIEDEPQLFSPPSGIHTDCDICGENYYTVKTQQDAIELHKSYRGMSSGYRKSIDDDTAQKMLYSLLAVVDNEVEGLKDVLKSHGDLILSRWTKKSKDKRGILLTSAADTCFGIWPPLTKHRLSMVAKEYAHLLDKPLSSVSMYGSGDCGAWINIEEFTDDRMRLFSLLHVRSAYAPREWAMFDACEMRPFFHAPSIPLAYNAKCVTWYDEDYGRLVDFDVDLIHRGPVIGFPRAMAAALVQISIVNGLRAVVKEIIGEALPSGNFKWTRLVSDGLHSSISGVRWGAYDNPGFAPPSEFDPEVLLGMACDQLDRNVDEIELLQIDPEYMRDYALTMKANISWDSSVSSSLKWSYIAGSIAALMTHRLCRWQAIVDKSRELLAICKKDSAPTKIGSGLPEDLEPAVVEYGNIIKDMIDVQLVYLSISTMEMDALKGSFTKFEERGELCELGRPTFTGDFKKQGDRINYASSVLQISMACRSLTSGRGALRNLSAELSEVTPDKRVDETCSTLALLDAMRSHWRSGHMFPEDDLRSTHADRQTALRRLCTLRSQDDLFRTWANGKRYHHLGVLLRDFCESPRPKNQNSPTWLDKRTETRGLLAKFWHSAREDWRQHQHDPESSVARAVVGYLSFDESPRYLAEVREESTTFEAELQRSRAAQTPQQKNVYIGQSVWGAEPDNTKIVRIKTKAVRAVKDDEPDLTRLVIEERPDADAIEKPAKHTIAVRQDSKSVIDKVFSRTATASNFRWSHLVNALVDAGMVATQSAGSAVRFQNDQGSIVLHHPHGYNHESTLSAEFLRNQVGKRLTKWFGWDGETFVERQKGGQQEGNGEN